MNLEYIYIYIPGVNLDHKTSHKGQFSEIEIYTSERSFPSTYGLRYNYLIIWNLRKQKNQNIVKIAFKVVQTKFLAMHVTNQKLSWYIYCRKCTISSWNIGLYLIIFFGIKEKSIILTHTMYCWLLLQI